ncbi:TonB-dependent receptor [Gramella jeungdoensis]|uniref:TonB-dependent receptor n=1 Tax=Gramella jeungdoensis TaxID=708091 RepID=A0ABT0Z198_9FLAO|nr:TonB-dependent receptor plug domain-containing protein [Gramella jeungdoensis]MCM8569493.1 TonB-dependent receptor [Gramella jeungdoensis]
MNIKVILVVITMLTGMVLNAQHISITGRFADAFTEVPLPQVKVSIEGYFTDVFSDSDGEFQLDLNDIAPGEYILRIDKSAYLLKRIPVNIGSSKKDLGTVLLQVDPAFEQNQQAIISLTDAELLSEEAEFDNVSGILQSSRDVFLNAAAFDFSQTFFRPRGLGSDYGKILINGLEMNKFYDGRPQWSNWGGLNDVQRNQVFTNGIAANDYQFGALGGSTNIFMRASKYQKGGRLSLAGSNRSYTGRMMATYASGEERNGWYYALSLGRRFAKEGYVDGTVYDANSFFVSAEKKLNEAHSINFSGIYTPNIRGRSAALTEEIFELKGRTYNPYWGYQNSEIRNSRMREIKEPILMLNHFWSISKKAGLNTNFSYQFGETANSRIDYGGTTLNLANGQTSFYGGGANPDPVYFQKLPSYFLRFEDNQNFEAAYRAQNEINENGQLDWDSLYSANLTALENGQNSIYALAEDVNKDSQISVNSILDLELKNNLKLNSSIRFSRLESQNFARLKDLLGGNQFLDIDIFVLDEFGDIPGLAAQSDLQNPNRLVAEKDRYKYDYDINAEESEVFGQLQWTIRKWEVYLGGNLESVSYQRNGNYQNGVFQDSSLGKSAVAEFLNFGIKSGTVYKISGRQNIELNAGYFTKSPGYRNAFINPRQNNLLVPDLDEEKIKTGDLSYRYRSSFLNFRLTGYFTEISDVTEVSYYYADGLSGMELENTTAFVQEVLSDMNKHYYGIEVGAESQLTSTIKVKSALALGEYIYANNPNLSLSSASFDTRLDYGKAYLKNYYLPGGPQTAAQLGFEYRDPDFWWFGTTLNYFSNAFIDINPLTRTTNFQKDYDGLSLIEYDPEIATKLLQQEKFDDYFLVNAVGGKSWRIKDKYLGTFISLNNIFNVLYKSGGYEQGRNANYRSLKEDMDRELSLFAPKYWYGQGTTFFANIYLRF